jgi:hypothetical protein
LYRSAIMARSFRKFYRPHTAAERAAIGAGVARRAAARRVSIDALSTAVDLIEQALVSERGQQIAERLVQRLRRARRPLTPNQIIGSATAFAVPHPTAVLAALVERGDIVLTGDGHYTLPERG